MAISRLKPKRPKLNRRDPLAKSLALLLPLHEGGGTVAHDLSGYGNNGTLTGGVTWTAGQFGRCLSFDGASGSYVIGAYSLPTSADWTVSCRFKITSASLGVLFAQRGGGEPDRFLLYYNAGTIQPQIGGGGGEPFTPSVTLSQNTWYHYALKKTGALYTQYIDGALDGSGNAGASTIPAQPLKIGNWDSDLGWIGNIGDFAVWSRPLSPAEVARLYADSFRMVRPRRRVAFAPTAAPPGGNRRRRVIICGGG